MMNLKTKGDLVNAALRKLGIASNATLTDVEPQSVEDAVNDLEMMMYEWLGTKESPLISIGYIFSGDEDEPIAGGEHGLSDNAISAVVSNLAYRISPDYAVEPSSKLIMNARNGKELLVKLSSISKAKKAKMMSGYPNRTPIGSGNILANQFGWRYFHKKEE